MFHHDPWLLSASHQSHECLMCTVVLLRSLMCKGPWGSKQLKGTESSLHPFVKDQNLCMRP